MPIAREENEILSHLGYEWWMAKATHAILLDMVPIRDPVCNALVESMNIHIRGLIAFFCSEPRKNDWSVRHLGHNLQILPTPPGLVDLLTAINKRVAHLTATRPIADGFVHEWRVEDALNFIRDEVEKVRTALGADFPGRWTGDAETTTYLLREISSPSVMGAPGQPFGEGIGATGPAPPSG